MDCGIHRCMLGVEESYSWCSGCSTGSETGGLNLGEHRD